MFARVLLVALAGVVLASAQGEIGQPGGGEGGMGGMERGGMGRGGGMGMGGGMGRVRTPARFETIFDKLKLSKDQKEEVSTVFDAAQQDAASVRDQLMRGRQVIAEAMLSKKSDEEINKYVQMYAQVEAQMTAIEEKAFSKICAMLKPNQHKNVPQAFELMAGLFQSGNWRMVR